jgi:hypothetical protein
MDEPTGEVIAFPQAPEGVEIRHLRAFVAVSEDLNFSRAAEVEVLGDRDERPQMPHLHTVGRLREGEHFSGHACSMPPLRETG